MNYIYDIVLNFQNNYYDFYEWKREDKIINIKKILLFKVTDNDLLNLKYNYIIVNQDFLEKIKENNKELICLVSNTLTTIALKFKNDGTLIKRSSLIFEEEEEANNTAQKMTITTINYKKNIKANAQNKLRTEIEKKDIIIKYLNKIKDPISLKYLYFEYYEKECNDINIIKKSLINEINKEWTIKQNNLYNIINTLEKNTLTSK